MAENDQFETQRDVGDGVLTQLSAVGFENAVEIGHGGFGVVYRCTQVDLDRIVAVKVLTGDLVENRERFFREQRAMGRLTGHPNIVAVLQVGELSGEHPYLVMQYHQRGSLGARIREEGALPVGDVLRLGVLLAGALETAHRVDVLHRDVKPENILLTDFDQPALTDFGIAHITGGFETATGTVTGSPAFTAPEVLSGDPPTPASDVYGLGATLFCALTGHAAFERRSGEQVVAQFLRITSQPVPDLRQNGIPEAVCATIESAMARDPATRPTATALGQQLQQLQRALGYSVEEMALRPQPGEQQERPAAAPAAVPHVDLARGHTGDLPFELTSFVGRRAQLTNVRNVLSGSRLVTLTGIGGVGKTRLALRAASKVRRNYADGLRLVELGGLRDSTLLVDVVAAAVGQRNLTGRPMREVLEEFLATRALLLVLDNCEHIVEAVAELAESLLRTCPDLSILATSREALGIGGESVLPLTPLDFPDPAAEPTPRELAHSDAVTLFTERAAAAVHGFELTNANRIDVARICARLDGLPLAIELAAARLRSMSTTQILQRLDDRFALLTRGSRGAPTRQQTLQWCIGWSYDLCTSSEQHLWARLSVFAGGFELDAAEVVCGEDAAAPNLLDAVSALVDKSILIREESDGAVRLRMLESVQDYGRNALEEAGEHLDLRRRHRDWCERLACTAESEWISPRQLEWISRLSRELPNLRLALEFGLREGGEGGLRFIAALYSFWSFGGRLSEGRRWTDRALVHSSSIAPSLDRARALYAAIVMAENQSDQPVATDRAAELRALAEQIDDPLPAALATVADGLIALAGGDPDRAVAYLDSAAAHFGIREELTFQIESSVFLGVAYALQGDSRRALASHEHILALLETHGEKVFHSWALWSMGITVWRLDDVDRAVQLLSDGLRLARMSHEPLATASSVEVLAWIASERGDFRRATVLMGAAQALRRAVGSTTTLLPNMLVLHDRCIQRARNTLGERAFRLAYDEGEAMSFDAAVGFTLGERVQVSAPTAGPATKLTAREQQIAELVAEGLTNKAIAARLVISVRTAQGHVEHILAKLGFTSRAQIASWVVEQSNG
ncbi:protein kinase [Rhodococcus sp. T2V]|uniref:protein kinase domain-containing protein n=1 Tax=Rhodococcus sp. T2V TaxID=3034164 RepID=UPI0023E2DA81|nr:protein kinase [Rhodococcus sp. T2V]MDF3313505.1 protein kinase [Rhodococcus sp. T2V]